MTEKAQRIDQDAEHEEARILGEGEEVALRCLVCGAPVLGAVCGRKSPCAACGFLYPVGDCSDLAEN